MKYRELLTNYLFLLKQYIQKNNNWMDVWIFSQNKLFFMTFHTANKFLENTLKYSVVYQNRGCCTYWNVTNILV